MQDNELLREYLESRSEAAFAELVRRYTGLVFSTARRKLGDLNLADDVSQTVFSLLVHKAGSLRNVPTLAGWLYRTTCFTAAKALRTEMRRRRHEQLALEMNEPDTNTNKIWEQLAPLLDEGMASLAEKDRLALLLRFFQREPMRTVGDALGISEAAAKMRVGRSVERLREFFVRRGLLCSTSGLAALLSERASEAAPPYLPTKLTAAALSVSSGSGPLFLTQILARLASFRVMPLFLGGVSAALLCLFGWHDFAGFDRPRPASVDGGQESHRAETVSAPASKRFRGDGGSRPDADLADAIAQLRAALRSSGDPDDPGAYLIPLKQAMTLFSNRLSVAFGVLKEEAMMHDPARHEADDAEVVPRRAVQAMGYLGKSVPEATTWLWSLFDAEPNTSSGSMASESLSALSAIGFDPNDISQLAERVLSRNEPQDLNSPPSNQADKSDESPAPDAFMKSHVAGWIAGIISKDTVAAGPFLSSVRDLLAAPDPAARFWAACALLPSEGVQNQSVISELVSGLQHADEDRLAWASQLLQDFGEAARPVAEALTEAAKASNGIAREWAFRAAGRIAAELRNQVPEVDQALTKQEDDQRLLDKINSRSYSGNDLVTMLDDNSSAVVPARLLGEMGNAATNALPALFKVFSRPDHGEDKGQILAAIRKIDPQAALAPEDVKSIMTDLFGDSSVLSDAERQLWFPEAKSAQEMAWCTRVGFSRFATNLAAANPERYSAFVDAVLAKEPAWRDLLH